MRGVTELARFHLLFSPGEAKPRCPRGALKHPPQTANRGKSSSMGALLLLSEFKRLGVKAANTNSPCTMNPHLHLLPESCVGEVLMYPWLPINGCVDSNTPTAHTSPRQEASCPAAISQRGGCPFPSGMDPASPAPLPGRGQGAGTKPKRGGHSRVGDMLSPTTPPSTVAAPGRVSMGLSSAG